MWKQVKIVALVSFYGISSFGCGSKGHLETGDVAHEDAAVHDLRSPEFLESALTTGMTQKDVESLLSRKPSFILPYQETNFYAAVYLLEEMSETSANSYSVDSVKIVFSNSVVFTWDFLSASPDFKKRDGGEGHSAYVEPGIQLEFESEVELSVVHDDSFPGSSLISDQELDLKGYVAESPNISEICRVTALGTLAAGQEGAAPAVVGEILLEFRPSHLDSLKELTSAQQGKRMLLTISGVHVAAPFILWRIDGPMMTLKLSKTSMERLLQVTSREQTQGGTRSN